MKSEDLFLAIGAVEETRLARSELCASSTMKQEEKNRNRKSFRSLRNLMVAVMVISLLVVAAYAAGGLLLFDSPNEMLAAIFGNQTGFDNASAGELINRYGDIVVEQSGFQRVPVDETVVGEDVAPYVNMVGKSVSSDGYTLTVDAFIYDETTKCGLVTYVLECTGGIPAYNVEANGEIWFENKENPVQVNQFGYSYLIQDKTTPNCMAATYYFRDTGLFGDDLVISLPSGEEPLTNEEIDEIISALDERIREELTPEEAVEQAKEMVGEAVFAAQSAVPDGMDMTQEEWDAERAYTILRDVWYHEEYEQNGPSICIPMTGESLHHGTALNGAIVISPLSFQLDATGLNDVLPNVVQDGMAVVSRLTIFFADGSKYVVQDDQLNNTIFKLVDSATEGESDLYNQYTCMFNRIIDVDNVTAVLVDGTRISVD